MAETALQVHLRRAAQAAEAASRWLAAAAEGAGSPDYDMDEGAYYLDQARTYLRMAERRREEED
jgi:hypothetical protein